MYKVDTKALQKAMIDLDIKTIGQLSEITGVNRNTLSDIINGKTFPSSMVMAKLAHFLHLTSEEAGRIFFYSKACMICKKYRNAKQKEG